MLYETEATHQRKLYFSREGFLVAESLDDYNHRRGHGLGQLIGAYGVVLQREVSEDHKATEAEGQEEELGRRQTFGGKDVQFLADVQAQPGDHKVHQGQGHVGEAVVQIDPFVEEHNADGHQQVEQEPGDDAPITPHSVSQRCHDLHKARVLQPSRETPGLSPAALALLLRCRVHAAADFTFWRETGSQARNSGTHMLCHRPQNSLRRGSTSRAPRPSPRDSGHPHFRPQLVEERLKPCAGALGSRCGKRLPWSSILLFA